MVFLSIFTCVFPSSPQYQISFSTLFNNLFINNIIMTHFLKKKRFFHFFSLSFTWFINHIYFPIYECKCVSSLTFCLFLFDWFLFVSFKVSMRYLCWSAFFSGFFENSFQFHCLHLLFSKKLNLILQNNTNTYNILNVFLYVKVTLIFIHSLHSVHFLQRLDFFSFERNQQKEVSCINSDHIFISRLFTFCMLLHFLFFSFIKDDYLSD